MQKLALAVTIFLSLSYNVEASQTDCEEVRAKAYSAMMEYQFTGKTDNKEIKQVAQQINMFDKKYEAHKYAFKMFDQCNEK